MVSKKKRLNVYDWDGIAVLDMGDIEIWDGADLALLREVLIQVIEVEKRRSIGINMRRVKYVPSGFFGMLHDWHERGIAVRLFAPQPNVQKMLWFRQFCGHIGDGCFLLLSEPKREMQLSAPPEWDDEPVWEYEPSKEPVPRPIEVDDGNWSVF